MQEMTPDEGFKLKREVVKAGGKLCTYLAGVGFYITFDSDVGRCVLF